MGTAWERHGMYESALTEHNGMDMLTVKWLIFTSSDISDSTATSLTAQLCGQSNYITVGDTSQFVRRSSGLTLKQLVDREGNPFFVCDTVTLTLDNTQSRY
jgi:hypothetical protein